MNKVIKIRNIDLHAIQQVLGYPIPFPEGRIRERFLSIIREKGIVQEKNRMEIVNAMAEKEGKDGKLKIIDGHYFFGKKKEAFDKAFKELMEEDVLIDVNHSIANDLPKIKALVENSPVALRPDETKSVSDFVDELDRVLSKKAPEKEEVKKETKKKK